MKGQVESTEDNKNKREKERMLRSVGFIANEILFNSLGEKQNSFNFCIYLVPELLLFE